MQRWGIWMPFVILFVMIGTFGNQMNEEADPTAPAPQVGKPMPAFTLPRLYSDEPLTEKAIQGPALVNVFGSWCVACVEEHPIWKTITPVIPVYGIAWKDQPSDTQKWLDRYGNPYADVALDKDSKFALDWGVTGAPETYVVDHNGVIVLKVAGQVTKQIWQDSILPRIKDQLAK